VKGHAVSGDTRSMRIPKSVAARGLRPPSTPIVFIRAPSVAVPRMHC